MATATALFGLAVAPSSQWARAEEAADQVTQFAADPPDSDAAVAADGDSGKQASAEAVLRKALGAADDELVGVVVELNGDKLVPVPDVKVLVWESDEKQIRSDKNGTFRAKLDLPDDEDKHLLLRFVKPGYADHFEMDWHIGHRAAPVAILDKTTWIEGVIRRPDGAPAADVLLRADLGPSQDNPRAAVDHLWLETRTDGEGRYKLLVDPNWYALEVRAPGIGTARVPKPGEEPQDPQPENDSVLEAAPKLFIQEQGEHRRLDIQLEPGIDFHAKLVDSVTVQPIAGARLWHWQFPGVEGHTDEHGAVTIKGMPPGEFTFMIEASGYVHGWSDSIPERWQQLAAESFTPKNAFPLDEGLPFDLAKDMQAVTIRLEPAVTIQGRVLDPDGLPVAGATVAPARTGTGRSLTGDTRYSVTSQNDGSFVAILPASGDKPYNLVAHDGEYGQWRKWANGVGEPFQAAPGQKLDNVELRLARPGTIRGRIVDEKGEPVAGVYVQTTASDMREQNYYNPNVRSGADGEFELQFVRPGKHRLHGWMNLPDEKRDNLIFPEVVVEPGKTTEVDELVIPLRFRG